jgi:hypothetical protein
MITSNINIIFPLGELRVNSRVVSYTVFKRTHCLHVANFCLITHLIYFIRRACTTYFINIRGLLFYFLGLSGYLRMLKVIMTSECIRIVGGCL